MQQNEYIDITVKYTNFIIQQLNISHFVPAVVKDGVWVVLEEPENYDIWVQLHKSSGGTIGFKEHEEYQTALDNVVFPKMQNNRQRQFYIIDFPNSCIYLRALKNSKLRIEDLIQYNLEITDTIAEKFKL